jgi:hypothetical protein
VFISSCDRLLLTIFVVVGLMRKSTAPEWVQHQRASLRIHNSQPKGWNLLLASISGVFVCAKCTVPGQELYCAWNRLPTDVKVSFWNVCFSKLWDLDILLHTCSTE